VLLLDRPASLQVTGAPWGVLLLLLLLLSWHL
jgi:hypothetical protein